MQYTICIRKRLNIVDLGSIAFVVKLERLGYPSSAFYADLRLYVVASLPPGAMGTTCSVGHRATSCLMSSVDNVISKFNRSDDDSLLSSSKLTIKEKDLISKHWTQLMTDYPQVFKEVWSIVSFT